MRPPEHTRALERLHSSNREALDGCRERTRTISFGTKSAQTCFRTKFLCKFCRGFAFHGEADRRIVSLGSRRLAVAMGILNAIHDQRSKRMSRCSVANFKNPNVGASGRSDPAQSGLSELAFVPGRQWCFLDPKIAPVGKAPEIGDVNRVDPREAQSWESYKTN
jgi:hypothetical protein